MSRIRGEDYHPPHGARNDGALTIAGDLDRAIAEQREAEQWRARATAAEDDLDRYHAEQCVPVPVAHLRMVHEFLADLARTGINPIAKRARTRATTLAMFLPPSEADDA